MMSEELCVEAFKQGIKQDAERLLPIIQQPADIRTTTTHVSNVWWHAREVSIMTE